MMLPFPAPYSSCARRVSALVCCLALLAWTSWMMLPPSVHAFSGDKGLHTQLGAMADCSDSGILVAMGQSRNELGKCPLKHTDVKANISGYVARVTVRQQFHNPYNQKIEAVYTFPLPDDAAVDDMTMKVGNRVIKGAIKKKEEARQTYEAARARGNVASLLDQERPNIFTQSVANIEPGENIDIEIKYVNLLKYEDGAFTFAFPTVVGPRFIPGGESLGKTGVGIAENTDMVPDASKITPPAALEGERAGHDISIEMNINAGVKIQSLKSKLHDVDIQNTGPNTATVKLKDKDKIPNKDFIATWDVAQESIQSGYLSHREGEDGFFTIMMVPPKAVTPKTVQPKEMVFLIDCSGSQRGLPLEKAKETMEYILAHMNPRDSFQVITFNNAVEKYPAEPQVASASMKEHALEFIHQLTAHGGTWMAPAVETACSLPNPDHKLRIVTFMTDGFVGNDFQIISMIKKYRDKSRWFSFGTGNSVNRFLIDNIAKEGGGEADYVLLNSSAEEVGKKFYDRISSPVLTDLKVEFEGVQTKEVFPKDLADLWAQRPLYFTGRYLKPGQGKVILTGYSGGKHYRQELKLDFPEKQSSNDVLPSVWARAKVERLMSEDWMGLQTGGFNKELREEIESTALKYHIMSQYTSFVAVEEDRKTSDGKAKLVPVPVETPEGVHNEQSRLRQFASNPYAQANGAQIAMHGYAAGAPTVVHQYGGGYSASAGMGGIGFNNAAQSSGPVPIRAGVGSGNGYGMAGGGGGGLPPTNMGRFVHQPGDNQYQPGAQVSRRASDGYVATVPMSAASGKHYYAQHVPGAVSVGASSGLSVAAPMLQGATESSVGSTSPSVNSSTSGVHGSLMNRLADGGSNRPAAESSKAKEKVPQKKDGSENKSKSSSKIDRDLQSLLDRLARGEKSGRLVNGKLKVRLIFATAPDAAFLEKLKGSGVEVIKRGDKFIIVRVEPAKLTDLSNQTEVIQIKLE